MNGHVIVITYLGVFEVKYIDRIDFVKTALKFDT